MRNPLRYLLNLPWALNTAYIGHKRARSAGAVAVCAGAAGGWHWGWPKMYLRLDLRALEAAGGYWGLKNIRRGLMNVLAQKEPGPAGQALTM